MSSLYRQCEHLEHVIIWGMHIDTCYNLEHVIIWGMHIETCYNLLYNLCYKVCLYLTPLWSGLFWWGNNIKKQQT